MNTNCDFDILADLSKTTGKTEPARNFLIEKCSYCNEEMKLVDKTVIYGAKWYHNFCWVLLNRKNSEKIIQNCLEVSKN